MDQKKRYLVQVHVEFTTLIQIEADSKLEAKVAAEGILLDEDGAHVTILAKEKTNDPEHYTKRRNSRCGCYGYRCCPACADAIPYERCVIVTSKATELQWDYRLLRWSQKKE